jgi:hypothetical protein
MWIEPIREPPGPSPWSGSLPTPSLDEMQLFREACLHDHWWEELLPDFDFRYMLRVLKYRCLHGGYWLDAILLRDLVDWHDAHGDLWWYVSASIMSL